MARWMGTTAAILGLMALGACADDPAGQPQVGSVPPAALEEEPEPPECPVPLPEALAGPGLKIASFTVDGLGIYSSRADGALACLLAPFDLVVVPGLAAPPYEGSFANAEPYRPAAAATAFFDAMRQQGFRHVLAPEDTGPERRNQLNSELTSWPAVFLREDRLTIDQSRPSGYIEPDVSANPTYGRVPYALALETPDGGYDFLLVTLELSDLLTDPQRRRYELSALSGWLQENRKGERDVLVAGTFNFASCGERDSLLPAGFVWLDPGCQATDISGKRPLDGIVLLEGAQAEVAARMTVLDTIAAMRPFWLFEQGAGYPGDPLNAALFTQYYSGHRPVAVRLLPTASDSD